MNMNDPTRKEAREIIKLWSTTQIKEYELATTNLPE